jgi:hypothetical protein
MDCFGAAADRANWLVSVARAPIKRLAPYLFFVRTFCSFDVGEKVFGEDAIRATAVGWESAGL